MQMFFNGKKREVIRAYNGKRNRCMCGCAGNYAEAHEEPFKVAARIRKIENFIGPLRPDAANYGDAASYCSEPFGDDQQCYAYVQQGNRNTTVYFKP